eukprot:Ihof_evm2s1114 gene=Ihof_evmTU2s1114
MRAVVQRVLSASVAVEGETVGKIEKGLCVLIGIGRDDTEKDMDYMVRKIVNMRVFEDTEGKMWAKSVKDLGLELLCVSQFTLWGKMNGNKPDFHDAMESTRSKPMYAAFLQRLGKAYNPTKIQ